jgi:hypothetical protein
VCSDAITEYLYRVNSSSSDIYIVSLCVITTSTSNNDYCVRRVISRSYECELSLKCIYIYMHMCTCLCTVQAYCALALPLVSDAEKREALRDAT